MKKIHMHVIPLLFLLICKLINRYFISGIPLNDKINQSERLRRLNEIAISQMKILTESNTKYLKEVESISVGKGSRFRFSFSENVLSDK